MLQVASDGRCKAVLKVAIRQLSELCDALRTQFEDFSPISCHLQFHWLAGLFLNADTEVLALRAMGHLEEKDSELHVIALTHEIFENVHSKIPFQM